MTTLQKILTQLQFDEASYDKAAKGIVDALMEIVGENLAWKKAERQKFSLNDLDSFQYQFAVNGEKDRIRTAIKEWTGV